MRRVVMNVDQSNLSNRHTSATHASLLVLDAEMTGLDPNCHDLMEIGVIAATHDLVPIASMHLVLHVDGENLEHMNEWCQQHHGAPRAGEEGKSLSTLCRESTLTRAQADRELEFFFRTVQGSCAHQLALCGNSVWRDLLFMQKQLPTCSAYLHHRVIDCTGARELAVRLCATTGASTLRPPKPIDSHCALYDALDALNFIRWHAHIMQYGVQALASISVHHPEFAKMCGVHLVRLPTSAHRRVGLPHHSVVFDEEAAPVPYVGTIPPQFPVCYVSTKAMRMAQEHGMHWRRWRVRDGYNRVRQWQPWTQPAQDPSQRTRDAGQTLKFLQPEAKAFVPNRRRPETKPIRVRKRYSTVQASPLGEQEREDTASVLSRSPSVLSARSSESRKSRTKNKAPVVSKPLHSIYRIANSSGSIVHDSV